MKKWFLVFLILGLRTFAQTVPVSTSLTDGTGNTVPGSYLHFALWNCGQNIPSVSGAGAIVQTAFDLKQPAGGGAITGNVIANDKINCGGTTASTRWLVTPISRIGQPITSAARFNICSSAAVGETCAQPSGPGSVFDLAVAQPDNPIPPPAPWVAILGNPSNAQSIVQPALGTGATITVTESGGAVNACHVGAGGTGYQSPPAVLLSGGGGLGALVYPSVSGGAVVSCAVLSGGSGYTSNPTASVVGGTSLAITGVLDLSNSTVIFPSMVSGSPAGPSNAAQYQCSGALCGSANFTWNDSTHHLAATNVDISGALSVTSGGSISALSALNNELYAGSSSYSTIASANTAVISLGGGKIFSPTNHNETSTSELDIGDTTHPVHLHFNPNSLFTSNLTAPGSGIHEGTDSRISGEGVAIPAIAGSASDNTTSLLSNTNGSEYFQFDHFRATTASGAAYSAAAFEIEGGFIPSYIDNVNWDCNDTSGKCVHFTTISGGVGSEKAGDYSIMQSWMSCGFTTNCVPVTFDTAAGGNMENISLFNVSTERPGLGKNVVSVDGTGGTINNLNFIAHRFEGDNGLIGDTTPLLNLNALNGSANMIYPWFAGNCTPGCNPPWVNISGSLNQFTMLGAASFSAGGVTNAADGGRTISGQDYIPYYFYSASGNQGVIAVSPQVYSSPGNTDLNLHINSGGSSGGSSHTTNLFFDDQNVSQWNLQKPSSNLIQLLDSVNNLARMVFIANGSTIIGSGNGANPVTINQKTNAGTGGLQVYSGGATPARDGRLCYVGICRGSLHYYGDVDYGLRRRKLHGAMQRSISNFWSSRQRRHYGSNCGIRYFPNRSCDSRSSTIYEH